MIFVALPGSLDTKLLGILGIDEVSGLIVVWDKKYTLQETSPHIPLKGKAGKSSLSKVPTGNYRICDRSLRIFFTSVLNRLKTCIFQNTS